MSLNQRFVNGTVLNFIAVVFNQGSTLIANIFVARIFTQQSFGEYSMVLATLLTMSGLTQLATGYTAAKYIAETRIIDPERAGRIMGVCSIVSTLMAIVGALLLMAFAPWLANKMLNAPHLSATLILGGGVLLFSSINGYQTGALSGLEAFASLAKAGVASGSVAIAFITFGAWWGGLNGALIGLGMSAAFRCWLHYLYLRKESLNKGIKTMYRGSLQREKEIILGFAMPAAIAGYFTLPMIWLANTFLVRQVDGYSEMALYAAANNLRIIVLFLPGVMNSVGLSILNNEKAKGDLNNFHDIFRSNVFRILLVSVCGAIVVGTLGRPILELFGSNYKSGYIILWFLLVSSIFEGATIAIYQYIQSKARIWMSLVLINIPRETVLVVTAYWMVKSYSGIGLAVANMVATIVGLILTTLVVFRLKNTSLNLTSH